MGTKDRSHPPWKAQILSLGMDGQLLKDYAKAAEDPFPEAADLLRKALKSILQRFPVPERQQILQRLQYISACERNRTMPDEVRKSEILETIDDLGKFRARRDQRSHDHVVLRRQKAVLQQYVYGLAPQNGKERISWIRKHVRRMWGITADRCFCDYAPWSPDIVETLVGSSPAEVIDKILAAMHRTSVPALRQLLKRSRSDGEDWHGPLMIPKKLAKDFIRLYGLKPKPGKDKDGSIEYEWPSGVDTIEFYADAMGQLLSISNWPKADKPNVMSNLRRKRTSNTDRMKQYGTVKKHLPAASGKFTQPKNSSTL